jgi:hypothetical protein
MTKLSTVTPTAAPVSLDNGALLGLGEEAKIDSDLPHNRNLIVDGNVAVIDGPHPRVRHTDQLVADAAAEGDH